MSVLSFLGGGATRRGSSAAGVSKTSAALNRKLLTAEFIEARDLYDVDKVSR